MNILVNGQAADVLSCHDRGLLYGDGCFTTLAIYQSRPLQFSAHWKRLTSCVERLGLAMPLRTVVQAEANALCQQCQERPGSGAGVLKIILTRGVGGRGYRIPATASACTRILQRHPWPDYPAQAFHDGIALALCQTRLGINPALAGIKHLNRLEQILAQREWGAPYGEGLMLDADGCVLSGTFTNLFWVSQGKLITPDVSRCGIAGVMRAMAIKTAILQGIPVEIGRFTLNTLTLAQEIFICNSVLGIWPVHTLLDKHYAVGPITRQLQQSPPLCNAMVPYHA